jgi:hypothetical protein
MAVADGVGQLRPVPYWKCFLAALPELVLGALFVMAAWRVFTPLMRPGAFGTVMKIEFFVIHSTIFLGLLALVRATTSHEELGRKVLFWGLFSLYLLSAFGNGVGVGIGFLVVMLGTNAGILMTWRTRTAALQLVVRWIVGTILFMVAIGLAGMPKDVGRWGATQATFVSGALYFLVMGALEASGFFLRAVPRCIGHVTPAMLGDFHERAPNAIRELFAATGRVAEPWIVKLKARLAARRRS